MLKPPPYSNPFCLAPTFKLKAYRKIVNANVNVGIYITTKDFKNHDIKRLLVVVESIIFISVCCVYFKVFEF